MKEILAKDLKIVISWELCLGLRSSRNLEPLHSWDSSEWCVFGEKVKISQHEVEKVKVREGKCENPSALMAKIKEEGGISETQDHNASQCSPSSASCLSYQTSSPPHPHPAPLKSSSQPSQALPSRRPTPPGAFLPHLLLLPSPLLTRSLFTYKRDPVPLILLLSECHDFCHNCTSFEFGYIPSTQASLKLNRRCS